MSDAVIRHEYRGHTIAIRVQAAADGQWTWSYAIEGIGYKDYGARPRSSYDLMLSSAIDEGKRRIDAFEDQPRGATPE